MSEPLYRYPKSVAERALSGDPSVLATEESLGSSGRTATGALLVLGIICFLAGGYFYFDQFLNGLATTAMNNLFTWGLAIAAFAFLVGFGAGGQIVASVLVLRNRRITKLAAASSVVGTAAAIGAGVAIMADLGNPLNILAMLAAPNIASPLTWDMVSLTLFIVVSIVMSYLCMAPFARDNGRTFLYRWTCKHTDGDAVERRIIGAVRAVAVVGIIVAVLLQVVEGLIFAYPSAHAWWHSFVVPVDFLAVAVVCGSSLASGIGAFAARRGGGVAWAEVSWLTRFAAIAIVVHLVLAIIELAMALFGSGLEAHVAAELGAYGPLYAMELLLPLAAAVLFWRCGDPSRLTGAAIGAVLVVIGIFAHRLMLLFPAFNVVPLYDGTTSAGVLWEYPVSSGLTGGAGAFITGSGYVPTIGEWGVSALAIGIALILACAAVGCYISRR